MARRYIDGVPDFPPDATPTPVPARAPDPNLPDRYQRAYRRGKRIVGCGAIAVTAVAGAGLAFAAWLNSDSGAPKEEGPRKGYTAEPFPTSTGIEGTSSAEPTRSSADDLDPTPSDGWTTDPADTPSASPSRSAAGEASGVDTDCTWDTTKRQIAGKTAVIAEVRGYDECVPGGYDELSASMKAYEKPDTGAATAFALSNGATIELGCKIENSDWWLVRSRGVSGENRAFVRDEVVGQPDVFLTCPDDYQDAAGIRS